MSINSRRINYIRFANADTALLADDENELSLMLYQMLCSHLAKFQKYQNHGYYWDTTSKRMLLFRKPDNRRHKATKKMRKKLHYRNKFSKKKYTSYRKIFEYDFNFFFFLKTYIYYILLRGYKTWTIGRQFTCFILSYRLRFITVQ